LLLGPWLQFAGRVAGVAWKRRLHDKHFAIKCRSGPEAVDTKHPLAFIESERCVCMCGDGVARKEGAGGER